MMPHAHILAYLAVILAGAVVFRTDTPHRSLILTALSLGGIWFIFFSESMAQTTVFALYAAFVLAYLLICIRFSSYMNWKYWIAFLPPVAALVAYKAASWNTAGIPVLVGFSYMSFRLSYLAYELNSDEHVKAGYWDYAAHAFFLPTFLVGPISPFENYRESCISPIAWNRVGDGFFRIFIGLTKVVVVASAIGQFTTMQLVENAYYYGIFKLCIAALANLLYLYFNFSGFSDVAIGSGAVVGIRVAENFNRPFAQTNFRDFWNHWHITLTHYVRDIIYTPTLMYLMRNFSKVPVGVLGAIAASVSFFIIGIWHGNGPQYILLGAMYALGVIYAANGPDLLSAVGISATSSAGRKIHQFCGRAATIGYMAVCVTIMFLPEGQIESALNKLAQLP